MKKSVFYLDLTKVNKMYCNLDQQREREREKNESEEENKLLNYNIHYE